MKHLPLVVVSLSVMILTACVDTTGLSKDSAKTPKGNPNAAVVVTEFADLQCPACGAAYPQITKPLLEKYGNQIRFDYKHFPLRSIHRFALEAAEASECAADQGKFWEFVDITFVNQKSLNSQMLRTWAMELDLDMDLFERCLKSEIKRDVVLAEYEEGRELGVGGTPTFFVNSVRVESGLEELSAEIDKVLQTTTQRL